MNSREADLPLNISSLKILFVLLTPIPYPGAAWNRIEYFANHMKNLNFKISIAGAFSLKTIDQAGSTELNGIRISNFVPIIMTAGLLSNLFNILSSFIFGFVILLLTRPDIVVMSVPASGNSLGFYSIAQLFRCKIITDYRDEWEDFLYNLSSSRLSKIFFKIMKDIMTRCYCKSNVVLAVTQPFADSLSRRGVERVKIVPNGADLTMFCPKDKILSRKQLGLPENDFIIIFSGHVGGYYRLDIVMRALKQVVTYHNPNTRLIIAGRGYSIPSILSLADELGIREKVVYLGKIMDKERLVEALCSADVGIIPYDSNPLWRNSLPVKSLEYLACGLPLLATAYIDSVIGRIIIENDLGVVTKSDDIDAASQAINRMQLDQQFRINAGKRGVVIINKSYDRHKIAIEFSQIVSDCIGGKK